MHIQLQSTAARPPGWCHADLLPSQSSFELSPAGVGELHGTTTCLSPVELELLVRCDGAYALSQVRLAMDRLDDAQFASVFRSLWQGGLLREVAPDRFRTDSERQLKVLAQSLKDARPAPPRPNGGAVSMGLVWRRPGAMRHAAQAGSLQAVVVEDDPVLARFTQCFLALEGFEVRLAANRAEVMEGFRAPKPPDLVLLDVVLPDADGFDVLRKLRAHPRLQHVPVIMLTGKATRESVLKALALGADGYLTKPFDAEVLAQAARAAVGLAEAQFGLGGVDPWNNADALDLRAARRN